MFPYRLLDKTCSIQRQTLGPGTTTKTTVAAGIRCAAYGASGWGVAADGGVYDNRPTIYVGDLTGSQIPGGLKEGDFISVAGVIPGGDLTYIVRRTNFWQNAAIFRSAVIYSTSVEPVPNT